MIDRAVATFGLDCGRCPSWLFRRMVKLGGQMVEVMVDEFGPDELIRRLSNPVWFQSLGTVLAFDWNSSGLTTILTAALKEAVRGRERELGVFICGGKGRTSRQTPKEIIGLGVTSGLSTKNVSRLVYNSRMAAKVDSALLQDGFQIYHHAFFFCRSGRWAVVQQGMNIVDQTARRYHWHSDKASDLVSEPHSGIAAAAVVPVLDLTSRRSAKNREISVELVGGSVGGLMKDLRILRRHATPLSRMISVSADGSQYTGLHLAEREFRWHPVLRENFADSSYLKKILTVLCADRPKNYEELLSRSGVGPKTIRALSLVAEMIYGAKPSYEDPARFSFAFGGKDGTPFPVDRLVFDETIDFFRRLIKRLKVAPSEKGGMLLNIKRLTNSLPPP